MRRWCRMWCGAARPIGNHDDVDCVRDLGLISVTHPGKVSIAIRNCREAIPLFLQWPLNEQGFTGPLPQVVLALKIQQPRWGLCYIANPMHTVNFFFAYFWFSRTHGGREIRG